MVMKGSGGLISGIDREINMYTRTETRAHTRTNTHTHTHTYRPLISLWRQNVLSCTCISILICGSAQSFQCDVENIYVYTYIDIYVYI